MVIASVTVVASRNASAKGELVPSRITVPVGSPVTGVGGLGFMDTVVLMKSALTPPMVTVVVVWVLVVAAEVWRTVIVCPALIVLAALVKVPPAIEYSPFAIVTAAGAVFP